MQDPTSDRSTGKQNLCDAGLYTGVGCLPDQTFRLHRNGEDFGGRCVVGSFAEYSVLSEWSRVKIEDYVPMELAALVSCGVTTGSARRSRPALARGQDQTDRAHHKEVHAGRN
jgi:Zn-dependent alcohol dehydrogenase